MALGAHVTYLVKSAMPLTPVRRYVGGLGFTTVLQASPILRTKGVVQGTHAAVRKRPIVIESSLKRY